MGKLVILKLDGDLEQQGFRVTAEIGIDGDRPTLEVTGFLPADPNLMTFFDHWQQSYRSLGGVNRIIPQEIIYGGSINRLEDCRQSSRQLCDRLNDWLESRSFRPVDQHLREALHLNESIRVLIRTNNGYLRRLPWHMWNLMDHYTHAEIALGAQSFKRIELNTIRHSRGNVRILAILGNSAGLNIEEDRAVLERLPNAEVQFLVEPPRQQINQQLWDQPWDILFFAGHSQSQAEQGRIAINPQESLTLDELKYGLRHAIAQGLQLAIFNSCDGLGLAQELEQLYLPQMIVMREPVPDLIAHAFLQQFLAAFVRGESLYTATRQAREQLQGLEGQFPCASWLPVICQSSFNCPINWQELIKLNSTSSLVSNRPKRSLMPFSWQPLRFILLSSWMITTLVMGLRWLGGLQWIELLAFDQLMRSRPSETVDHRLLLVTIDEADLVYQNQQGSRLEGSLSDQTLQQLLAKLDSYQPAVIGLDIYRTHPIPTDPIPTVARVAKTSNLKSQSIPLIPVCTIGGSNTNPTAIAPPPSWPLNQIGFADTPLDPDLGIRRQYLGLSPGKRCNTDKSLSYQLALHYLQRQNIQPIMINASLYLGQRQFSNLESPSAVYHRADLGGYDILLNYRASSTPAPQVSLSDLLSGRVDRELPQLVRDRVVLIGTIARSFNDYHQTPLGEQTGVEIQAHMVSQILSAVLNGRPLLWYLPQWGDVIWVGTWAMVGGILALAFPTKLRVRLATSAALGCLYGICFLLLLNGGWLPLIPSALALIGSGCSVTVYRNKEGGEVGKDKG